MIQPLLLERPRVQQHQIVGATRVLHLINGEHYSGAERVQDLLAIGLRRQSYEVGFVCLKPGKFDSERKSKNNQLDSLVMKSKFDFRFLGKLISLVRKHGYQLVHAHTPRTVLIGSIIAWRLRLPLIYHVHSPVGRDSTRRWNNWINQRVESTSARRVDHFICVSESLKRYMIALGHAEDQISTVPNGVPMVHSIGERSTPDGTWTLGTTALFRPRKGIEILIEALALLNQQNEPVKLLAVGPFESRDYEQQILQLADRLQVGHLIHWTGFVNDVDQYFREMDLFVLPSLFGEGLPMVILEAMASGIPVVAAEVEGVTEAIRHNRDGLIFEPGRATSLAARVKQFISGETNWQAIRQSALNRHRDHFSDESMAAGVAEIYDRLLDCNTNYKSS